MTADGCIMYPSDTLQATTVLTETSGVASVLELELVSGKRMQEVTFRHWVSCTEAIAPREPVCLRAPVREAVPHSPISTSLSRYGSLPACTLANSLF